MAKRKEITTDQVNLGVDDFIKKLFERLEQKGYGTFSSKHEILGILKEEMNEVEDAVHQNNNEELEQELLDVAVGCIFGYVCIKNKTVDW